MAKLEHLDGLRGSAAVVVVLHHFACAFLPAAIFGGAVAAHMVAEKTVYQTPLQLLVAGNFAVCIFFALSGFVLSHKFFQTHDGDVVTSAAVRRYFRLMPPILLSILVGYGFLRLGVFYNQQAAAVSGSQIWLGQQWLRTPGFFESIWQGLYVVLTGNFDASAFNNVLWTMKIEFFGSFLVFGFLALFGRAHYRWIVYLVLAVLTFNSYYMAFVLGIALSDFTATEWSTESLPWLVTLPLAMVGLFLGAAPIVSSTRTAYWWLYAGRLHGHDFTVFVHVIGAFLVLTALLYSPLLKRALSTRPMRYLGRVSFSVYLLHVLVIGSVGSYVFIQLAGHHRYSIAVLGALVATLTVSFLMAELFTRRVDQPAIRLSGVVYQKLFSMKHLGELTPSKNKKNVTSEPIPGRVVR